MLREENTVAPVKARQRKTQTPELDAPAKPIFTKGHLPAAIARRYNGEPSLFRRHIDYYEGGGAAKPAFRDRGDKLVAFQNDPNTVASLIAIAHYRGWTHVEIRGDDTFRREAWKEAHQLGIKVKGYRPKARDLDEIAKEARPKAETLKPARKVAAKAIAQEIEDQKHSSRPAKTAPAKLARPNFDKGVTGVLLAHGVAPYRHRQDEPSTPFACLDIGAEKPLEVWGVGLPAAISAAKAKTGDLLTLKRQGVEMVEIKVGGPDAPARVVPRNRWSATAERPRPGRSEKSAKDLKLTSAQARLAVVEAVARAKLSTPGDRAKVTAAAKARISQHLKEGRTFSAPREAKPEKPRDRPGVKRSDDERGPERTRGR